jgi:pimeloyl-ACP methyl ester carboxylesterase
MPSRVLPAAGYRRALHLAAALILACGAARAAPDYEREKRWADEIVPALVIGDPVYLQLESGRRFLAIHAAAAQSAAAVIVVHGLGVHPDWGLNNTLRSQLYEQGYTTLAVQMPVLAAGATAQEYSQTFPEAAQRLASAVDFLRGKGYAKIGLVSHSMGARMAEYFIGKAAGHQVDAWVALGIPGEFVDGTKLGLPVLDLYGERDFPAVLAAAPQRAQALRAARGSGQIQVEGADHFFDGREQELVRWTKRFFDRTLR